MKFSKYLFFILFFGGGVAISIWFFNERSNFLDLSFHLFYLIKDETFAIQNNRFVAAATQIFPLLGIKLGVGLSGLMLIYSLSFVLVNLIYFFIIQFLLKEERWSYILVGFTLLFSTHCQFWIQSEFPQGLSLLTLYFAALSNGIRSGFEGKRAYLVAALALLQLTVVFSHPLIVFPAAFGYLVLFFDGETRKSSAYQVSIASLLAFLAIKTLFFGTAYDSSAISTLGNFKTLFPNYFNLDVNRVVIQYFIRDYWPLTLLGIGLGAFLFWAKKYAQLFFLSSAVTGYILLVNVSYADRIPPQFYHENLLMPVSVFVVMLAVYEWQKHLSHRWVQLGLIAVVAFKLIQWSSIGASYSERLLVLDQIIDHHPPKAIIALDSTQKSKLIMDWAITYEVWLRSTAKSKSTHSIIAPADMTSFDWTLGEKQTFFTQWGVFPYDNLNPRYFHFKNFDPYVKVGLVPQ